MTADDSLYDSKLDRFKILEKRLNEVEDYIAVLQRQITEFQKRIEQHEIDEYAHKR